MNKNKIRLMRALELFGTMLGQEISKSPLTPKDTGLMRSTFANSLRFINDENKPRMIYTTPYYTKYVNEGTNRIKSRKFIQQNIHQKANSLLKKSFKIASNQIK